MSNVTWRDVLGEEVKKEYFQDTIKRVREEYDKYTIYPKKREVFNAFKYLPFKDIKVVIIGQDPYHNPNQANGLAFSVKRGVRIPPSLLNIYKELSMELGLYVPNNGDLFKWVKQGVLLMNSTLTVRENQPNSHKDIGWEQFTDKIIEVISDNRENVVFLLWGNYARSKKRLIDENKHLVLEASHPSPFSANRGFFGCNHFLKTNEYLSKMGKSKIDWQIENI